MNRSRPGPGKSARRREELRRNLGKPAFDARALLQQPRLVQGLAVLLVFALTAGMLVIWSREQTRAVEGRITTGTRLNRIDFSVSDDDATEARRREARLSAPQVWRANTQYLARLEAELNGLPKAVAGKQSIEEIQSNYRDEYGLTDDGLAALQPFAVASETTLRWKRAVGDLVQGQMQRYPLIDTDEYQNRWVPREYSTELQRLIRTEEGGYAELRRVAAIELVPADAAELEADFVQMASRAGFPAEVVPFVVNRVLSDPSPTLLFDVDASTTLEDAAAQGIEPVYTEYAKGGVIYRAGDVLSTEQRYQLETEAEMFAILADRGELWLPRLGLLGLVTILVFFAAAAVATAYPRITRNWVREAAIAILITGMLAVSAVVSAQQPNLLFAAAVAPALLVAVIVRLAYDQRLAILLSGLTTILITLALAEGMGFFVLLMVTSGTAIARLRELRHRNSLIRAATFTAVVAGTGTVLLGLLRLPAVDGAMRQLMFDAGWSVSSAFAVGFLVLGLLPSIERMFDITTGMTLAELRDTKQPLLRQLQQKAPGTYNHSLQVANIAEAAADAIGADGLLVYVGALYHDIGKMNKPEYFVENQAGGQNKHEKLSPAMSLLVIVGHVKDGIELAREYGLPRNLQHFIESHHGTTLVEYFYHAAREQAEANEKASVEEVEYRYPGPKPTTKEAAILMLSDAVESATRAMTDPAPGRIESLVREISRKRLIDGQFDRSDLTFRELGLIEESIILRLCAIHHGRISYPKAEAETTTAEETKASA
jgi:putative nucleotidyltransferase with HDIG domain